MLFQIHGQKPRERNGAGGEQEEELAVGGHDLAAQRIDPASGGTGHDKTDHIPVFAQNRTEIAVLEAHGALGIGEIPLSRQRLLLISPHEGAADPFVDNVINPNGMDVGNGEYVQIRCFAHQIIQIVHQSLAS